MDEFPFDDEPALPAAAEYESVFSTDSYPREVLDEAWNLAQPIPGNDEGLWRKDEFGAWMNRLDYGRRGSQFGWEICDLSAASLGTGPGDLRPMQWQNYLDHVSSETQSHVSADGLHNMRTLF
ncbi:MAG: hypothetical protein ACI8UO_001785 [Verrucomicrobiales bacterium]|jgi:hypothetical protein